MPAADTHPFGDPAALAPPRTLREALPHGGFILRHPEPLQPHARCIGAWLEHWARHTPDALFLAERTASAAWRRLTYQETRAQVGRIAQSLLDLELPAGPVVVLSDNSVDHALLALAAMHIGRPVCTVSSAYSRLSKDHSRIHAILDQLAPALVYASDARQYGAAMRSWRGSARRALTHGAEEISGALYFDDLLAAKESADVLRAFEAIGPDTEAKYLLTSGSTGSPKVVVNTHRMLCANQQQIAQVWPFLTRHKLVLLEWLPWSHTFGANHNFNMALCHGGALHIDEGRPVPGLIEKTLRNLRDVQPNMYFNVPRGFDMLLPLLEQDAQAARDVFKNLEAVFYAGAALPQSIWERLQALARTVRDKPLWFTSAWGSTETAPAVTNVHWRIDSAGCIGLPLPGTEVKFVPNGSKLELRVRGPNLFRAYRGAPDLTAKAFDEDGFYLIGDAGRLVDEHDPTRGIAFDGRVAEDFKLTTGTWVSVGTLRVRAVTALAPHVADVVVTGHDRAEIGLLVFPTPQSKALSPQDWEDHLRNGLVALRAQGTGSSQTPTRAMLMDEPLDADAGEITDKGYINQRAVIARRAQSVERLHASSDHPRVVRV
jgi:feruloyl-CoA synthase